MPVPAEIKRYLLRLRIGRVKMPAGPLARSFMPTFSWSSIQRVPMLPDPAFTVMARVSGRDGDDEIV